uniref:Uncharacterized protein ycf68 n=1 Tax=Fagus sylvatica TaxID=28930 RepID=A0A2N9F5N4_FAGSY
MVESVGGLRGGGLPCGGCQRFESAYLQLVNLADTKLYDSTQFFRFGSSIYDLSFMDVDKILPFSSTLGWHSLKVKGEVQTRKGLRWIPRHPETRKGVVSDEMLRGVENKRRSGDSRIGEAVECCTLDGESPVAESITSLRSDPSSMGHVESRVNQQGPPLAWLREPTGAVAKASLHRAIVTAYGPEPGGEMPLEPRASWFSPKCVEAQQLTGHLGGSRSASETMGDKLHRREGNSPDHQLRPLNDRSVIKEMNGAKRSAEAVGCKKASVGERSALEGSTRESGGGRSGSENVGLSNANIGENPMPRKPKGSSARFVHGGVRRGRENASSQCSSTRRYGAEVTHAILPGKARTTFNKRCRKVKEVGDLMTGEPATEAPVNGGRNYNGPKVAKFLVGLGGGRRRPPSGGARAVSEIPLWKS